MNIIEMAREVGLHRLIVHTQVVEKHHESLDPRLEKFAAIVRAEERQRTVEILMEMHRKANGQHNYYHFAANEIQGFSV
jgi:hypothetical protein